MKKIVFFGRVFLMLLSFFVGALNVLASCTVCGDVTNCVVGFVCVAFASWQLWQLDLSEHKVETDSREVRRWPNA